MPPSDWNLITLTAVDNEHAMNNRLNAEQIAVVLPIIVEQYPFLRTDDLRAVHAGLALLPRRCDAVEQAQCGCVRSAGRAAGPKGRGEYRVRLPKIAWGRMRSGDRTRAAGVIAIEESYDVSANVFSPVDQRKKAPPMIALEPRTLELVRGHRRHLMERNHPGLATGLVFPSEAGTRPVGNDQLNDVWRQAQVRPGSNAP